MKTKKNQLSFEEFRGAYGNTEKARFEIVVEEQRDLLAIPNEYLLAHCVLADLDFCNGIAPVFDKNY